MFLRKAYEILKIREKIADYDLRLLYLRNVWGLPQKTIAEIEGFNQPIISVHLRNAKEMFGGRDISQRVWLFFTADEIKELTELSRKVVSDIELRTFVKSILGLEVLHPFYTMHEPKENVKIKALKTLGIQQKRIAEIFNRAESSISTTLNTVMFDVTIIERPSRLHTDLTFYIKNQKFPENIWITN